jgi:hypothetical protein
MKMKWRNEIKENEMGRAYNTHDKHTSSGNAAVWRRIILKTASFRGTVPWLGLCETGTA